MRSKSYLLVLLCIFLLLVGTACDSESDRRKEKIKELDDQIKKSEEKIQLMDEYLNICEKLNKC